MKKILLTQGKFALIDDEDYPIISLFKWCAKKSNNHYYAITQVMINTKRYRLLMHRLINNTIPTLFTDHINGDSLDNRKINLRNCSNSQNMMNQYKHRDSNNKYKGVRCYKNKWVSQICFNYRVIYLGLFSTEKEAAEAYNNKALELHGEFARLNIIEVN